MPVIDRLEGSNLFPSNLALFFQPYRVGLCQVEGYGIFVIPTCTMNIDEIPLAHCASVELNCMCVSYDSLVSPSIL